MSVLNVRRVAIVQSNYVPWKGYFDLIRSVDEFLLYDEVQYTRRDWRNRNRIKTRDGLRWLSVPLHTKGTYHARIDEMEVSDPHWAHRHWDVLRTTYREAPAFAVVENDVRGWLEATSGLSGLSEINRRLIDSIAPAVGVDTPVRRSSEIDAPRPSDATKRLVSLCRAVGATEYVSGPAARAYLDETVFTGAGIAVQWAEYGGYPAYDQIHPPFEHGVTILDLLFHVGVDAARFMKPSVVDG